MERPDSIQGHTVRTKCGCGKLYISLNQHPDGYKEVFIWLGKSGGCSMSWCDAVARLITFALNSGTPRDKIVRAMKGVRCPSPYIEILSCADAIAKVLEGWEDETV